MKYLLPFVFLCACSEQKPAPGKPAASAGAAATAMPPGTSTMAGHSAIAVGAPVPAGEPISLADVLAKPEAYSGKTVLVEGKVRAACQKKGCWMEITPLKEGSPACRVRFKDYGFFVPKDSTGSEARVSGVVSSRVLPPEEVAHLEGEGATLNKGPDGAARAVEIMATGVELMRL